MLTKVESETIAESKKSRFKWKSIGGRLGQEAAQGRRVLWQEGTEA